MKKWSLPRILLVIFALILVASIAIVSFVTATSRNTITICYVSNINGYLEECGCPSNNAGGIARRVDFINSYGGNFFSPPILHLDAGGFGNSFNSIGRSVTKAIIQIYEVANLDAVNVSCMELGEDITGFKNIVSDSSVPYISANILDKVDGSPEFKPWIILDKGGKKIGITGITEGLYQEAEYTNTDDGYVISDAIKSLEPVMGKLEQEADLIILLAFESRRKINEIVKAYPSIDIVLGGDDLPTMYRLKKNGRTYISYPGIQGKHLGMIKVEMNNSGIDVKHKMVLLKTSLSEDKVIKMKVDKIKEELGFAMKSE